MFDYLLAVDCRSRRYDHGVSFDGVPPTINVTNINQNSNDGCLSGCGAIIAISLAIALLWAFVIAGWLLGSWVAVAIFGAEEGSTAAVVVGWVFEIAYLLLLLWIGVVLWRKRREGESGELGAGDGSVPGPGTGADSGANATSDDDVLATPFLSRMDPMAPQETSSSGPEWDRATTPQSESQPMSDPESESWQGPQSEPELKPQQDPESAQGPVLARQSESESVPESPREPQPTVAYCFECGAQLRPGAKYCTSCGTAQ